MSFPSVSFPTRAEIEAAAANLWTGDQRQHVDTVLKVLVEVVNMRTQEAKS